MGNSGSSTASRSTIKSVSSKELEATKTHLPLEVVEQQLVRGVKKWGLQVHIPQLGYRDCYLDTTDMSMRYLVPQQPWSYGNASLNWMIRDVGDKGARHLSNSVTDYGNEVIGAPKTYLETANRISSGGYSLQLRGNGVKVYFEYDPGKKDHTEISIYMQLDESSNADKYYLQPTDTTDDYTIIAKTEEPQNKYNFAIVDPEPTSS